ncbi:MAG: ABC-F family ATP-binding cassette domain-containing protein [Oscillospiraceae bacterium]|nr:ABC-F family ATP-binding cassette domain-containing protein [Oscillospiraceae bacterium]
MLINLENISKSYAGEQVLNNVSLTIEKNDRIGLVGINGCGKSTLLRIITDETFPDTQPEPFVPQIHRSKNSRIGFLAQNSGLSGDSTVIDEMRAVFSELLIIAKRLDELRESEISGELAEEYSKKTAFFEANDGYLIDVKIDKILRGMGYTPETHSRVISSLSGGERTRLALAKMLLEEPELLILDEPTNHLDFDTVLWLENYLKDYKGALLVVSHDRYFLDKLVTSVCEIERGVLRRFKGNYTSFVAQKKVLVEHQLKEHEAQNEEIAKLKDYIARNMVRASTSNMAKSRAKQLEKLEAQRIHKPLTHEKSAKIAFQYDREPPKELLTVKNIDIKVGNCLLSEDFSLRVRRGEKLAIVGANGTGKSTLLKILLGKLPHSKGYKEWGENVKTSYFEQTNTDIFDDTDTVINAVHKLHPLMTELQVRTLLGGVRLTGDDVYKKVGELSGGERAKLRMAIMSLERGNVLILDEPTNHLDITTRDVLETALESYSGTIIFVSHDRYLLNRLATRVLEIGRGFSNSYKGGFEEFLNSRAKRNITTPDSKNNVTSKNQDASRENKNSHRSKEQRVAETQRRVRVKKLEHEIERLESLISDLQKDMENPEIFSDHELLQEKCELLENTKTQLSEFTDEWLELSEEA